MFLVWKHKDFDDIQDTVMDVYITKYVLYITQASR